MLVRVFVLKHIAIITNHCVSQRISAQSRHYTKHVISHNTTTVLHFEISNHRPLLILWQADVVQYVMKGNHIRSFRSFRVPRRVSGTWFKRFRTIVFSSSRFSWMYQNVSKRQEPLTSRHGITFEKNQSSATSLWESEHLSNHSGLVKLLQVVYPLRIIAKLHRN